MKHILSVDQFSKADLVILSERAAEHERNAADVPTSYWRPTAAANGKILANLFYEPSTRTSSSFYSAMVRLGGHVIPINDVSYSSVIKGESLEDTIRTMQCYCHVIVLRHSVVGAADRATTVATVPIINAGDGIGEHPTQALLDLLTILQEQQWRTNPGLAAWRSSLNDAEIILNGLHVVMMGDLKHGRTVKSLAKLLRKFDVRISWVSPEELRIPLEFVRNGETESADLDEVIASADVLYVTRVQKERIEGNRDFCYRVTLDHMASAKPTMVLMHPLPRVEELPVELDSDPRSAYFRQMRYGLFMRMAVLESVLAT